MTEKSRQQMQRTDEIIRYCAAVAATLVMAAAFLPSRAETGGLSPDQAAVLETVAADYHIESCCATTMKRCREEKENCHIAAHLWEFAASMAGHGAKPDKIRDQLDKRYTGFVSPATAVIDTLHLPWAGDPQSPVAVVAYVSSSCNLCKHVVGMLYDSVTTGSLKGMVKLMAKPFGAGLGDIAFFAAQAEGKFWDLFLAMREDKTRYTEAVLVRMAEKTGIAPKRFRELLKDPALKQRLDASREEGGRNGVEITPTFFIDNKRYRSYKDARWVADAARYEYGTR